jgi:hypothetical protein
MAKRSGSFADAVGTAATIARPLPASRRAAFRWPLVALGCTALAALSLLVSRQTTYDPTAWLIWGRETVHGDLSTVAGPSWKPLPIVVTAPAALLGDAAQQQVWLVFARAGALAALVLTYRLAWRLAGPVAGVVAAGALLASSSFASRMFRGNSEGILLALAIGAIEAHRVGRRRTAFALLVGTALLRPEMCLFAAAYALWLARTAPDLRRRVSTLAVTGAAGGLIVAAWLVPEKIGSGDWLRAASRALEPVAGSPATAAHPFLATFSTAAPVVAWPIYATAIVLVAQAAFEARRTRRWSLPLALAALATAVMVVVAAMAEGGFTGNPRYLTIPIALTCVLGAAGATRLVIAARSWRPRRRAIAVGSLAAVIAAPFVGYTVVRTVDEVSDGLHESALYAALPDAISRAGGRAAMLRCGTPITAWFDTQAVARALHVHERQVAITARIPGTLISRQGSAMAHDGRYPPVAQTDGWVIGSSCR